MEIHSRDITNYHKINDSTCLNIGKSEKRGIVRKLT